MKRSKGLFYNNLNHLALLNGITDKNISSLYNGMLYGNWKKGSSDTGYIQALMNLKNTLFSE